MESDDTLTVSTLRETGVEERVLGRTRGSGPGPTLICVAALHGNEPCGVGALRRIFRALGSGDVELRGEIVGFTGNRKALVEGRRFLSRDLNRLWTEREARRIEASGPPFDAPEDEELYELDRHLRDAFQAARGAVYLLDLHSTSGPGPAFAVLDDTLENRAFAMQLPVPVVLGIEEELDGTLTSYLLTRGAVTAGFECGQHDDPASVDRGEAAVWLALEASGVLPRGSRPEVETARRLLAASAPGLPRVVETLYRHPIPIGEPFRTEPGFVSFQPIRARQTIGWNLEGPVRAPRGGRILMPLYQPQGNDGFFIVRDVRTFWLRLSATVRRLGMERIVHWLPGVRCKPGAEDVFIIDRRVARWYALELLHLLGFRRHGQAGRYVEVSRRPRQETPAKI
jgi:succinylglutamate desuccinylase